MLNSCLRKFATICIGMVTMAGFPAIGFCSDWGHIGADLNFWAQEGDVVLRGDFGSITGTPIHLESDLGLDTDKGLADGRVWLGAGGIHLVLTFYESKFTGVTTLQQDLTFDGQTFSVGENVDSVFDTSVLGVYYYQSFLPLKVVNIGFQAGVDILDLRAVLNSQASGQESVSETVPLPAVGVHIGIKPAPKFRIYADVSIFSASIGGDDFDLTDGRAQLEFYFNHFVGMHAGYRLFKIDVDSDEFGALDSTQEGPILGMTVRF